MAVLAGILDGAGAHQAPWQKLLQAASDQAAFQARFPYAASSELVVLLGRLVARHRIAFAAGTTSPSCHHYRLSPCLGSSIQAVACLLSAPCRGLNLAGASTLQLGNAAASRILVLAACSVPSGRHAGVSAGACQPSSPFSVKRAASPGWLPS